VSLVTSIVAMGSVSGSVGSYGSVYSVDEAKRAFVNTEAARPGMRIPS